VKLWEMSRADFDALLQRQPQMAFKMVTVLGGRLTAAHNASIQDLQEKNRQLQIAYDDLKAAQAQLVEKERLERELQLAAEIQLSILPRVLPQLPGYNFGAQLVPARFVGGDFYEFIPLDSGKIGIVIGDVSDKGVPSAIFMAQTHAFLYAEASRGLDPVEVLRRVNRHLAETNAAHLFVTVLYGILDHEQGVFTYARGGHELPLLAQMNGETHTLPWGEGQLLGILDDIVLDEQTIKMPPGSTLLLYTDGMTDIRNPAGERFGMEALENELSTLAGIRAQELCDRLVACLHSYQGDTIQDDDVTLVALKSEII
jgi:sigma-B regulation protein RsbU (phosphoserine phosphatase)